ncbi:MAG: FAD-binding oxidoreductase [Oscillospiraceae bacterium]|nr:FAD-binding oxidoreductase [Oscillospiraceae bacterium]
MAINQEAYKELELIVGKRWISQDIAERECYRSIMAESSAHSGPYDGETPLPGAVILPGSTEEVQAIVKICNKYDIHFKACSTFWSVMGFIGDDDSLQIDMKRMKKMEFHERDQYVIVEPYCIGAVVQVEAMKRGFNVNMAGVGCSSSTLAGASSWVAFGPSSCFMGVASENFLAVEWVLPNGDLLRTGTLGSGGDWFCGEGPGPSVRAILRGAQGTAGSFGVCTRLAVRLHPWPGPTCLPTYGTVPAYKLVPTWNLKTYTLNFPDWDGYANTINFLSQNQDIAYLGHRQYNMWGRYIKLAMIKLLIEPGGQLADLPKYMADPFIKEQTEKCRIDLQVVIVGMTKRDLEWKEKAIDEILRRVGGWKNEFMLQPEVHDWVLLYLLRLGHKNLNYTLCSSYEGSGGLSNNVFVTSKVMEEYHELREEFDKTHNGLAATGGDSEMGALSTLGGGGITGYEFFQWFDRHDRQSIKDCCDFIQNYSQKLCDKYGFGADMGNWNMTARHPDTGYYYTQDEQNAMFVNSPQPGLQIYQYLVKKAFNPLDLCGSYYRTLDPEYWEANHK